MVAPRRTEEYDDAQGQLVIVGACHEHVLPVQLWQERHSLDGNALVIEAETLSREWQTIFGGVKTPVVRLQRYA